MSAPETASTIVIQINGQNRSVRRQLTIAELLRELEITSEGTAVAINDAIIVRSQHALHEVVDGDRIEILHAVAGG